MSSSFNKNYRTLMRNKKFLSENLANFYLVRQRDYYYHLAAENKVKFYLCHLFLSFVACGSYMIMEENVKASFLNNFIFFLFISGIISAILTAISTLFINIVENNNYQHLDKKEYRLEIYPKGGNISIVNGVFYFNHEKVSDKAAINDLKLLGEKEYTKIFEEMHKKLKNKSQKTIKEKKKEKIKHLHEKIKKAIILSKEEELKEQEENKIKDIENFMIKNNLSLDQLKKLTENSEKIININKTA